MARQRKKKTEWRTTAPAVIAAEAKRLAKSYRAKPVRVRAGLDKLIDTFTPVLRYDAAKLVSALRQFPLSLLSDALAGLATEDAMTLIETGDLRQLARRIRSIEYLADERVPLYSLTELAERTEHFIKYLEADREHLVKTGLPRRPFGACRWLYLNLAKLYDIRTASSPWPREEFFSHAKNWDIQPYEWVNTPDEEPACRGSEIRPVSYEEADLLTKMLPEDAYRIETGRQAMFELKIKLLRELLGAALSGDATGLWERSSAILESNLSKEDTEFYLRMDRFYLGEDFRDRISVDPDNAEWIPGGLTNVLEAIGHYEKEITLGTLAKTRAALAKWIEVDRYGRFPTPEVTYGSTYFPLLAMPDRQSLDAALDNFTSLEQSEKPWWTTYRQRAKHLLERDNHASSVKPVEVLQKDEPEVHAKGAQEEIDPVARPGSVASVFSETYVFQRKGEHWIIGDPSEPVSLRHSKGLCYLASLLRIPGKPMHVGRLIIEAASLRPTSVAAKVYRALDKTKLAEENLSVLSPGPLGPVLDQKAKEGYKRRIEQLTQEQEDCRIRGDNMGAMACGEEIEKINECLAAAQGLGGRDRTLDAEPEKQRKAVTNAIARALDKIAAVHPRLGQHLLVDVETGATCVYKPSTHIRFQL